MKKLLLVVACAMSLSACAIGNKHDYNHQVELGLKGNGSGVAVGVKDDRNYVVSGNKTENFVGVQRGGFGNPFDVTTVSGQSLAVDMGETLARSLSAKGFSAANVAVAVNEDMSEAIANLKDSGAQKLLLLRVMEWKSDTYLNVRLIYNVELQILDQNGNKLADKLLVGDKVLGSSAFNPVAVAEAEVPKAFDATMQELLSDEAVIRALLQ